MSDKTVLENETRAAAHPGLGLPGVSKEALVDEIMRVDHAGEYGAVRIYEGQLAVFRHLKHKSRIASSLAHMKKEEEVHLSRFSEMLNERRVRPTALVPFWHVAGFAMGAATALLGEKAAHACTAAVEEVIDEHYRGQRERLAALGADEKALSDTIEKFRLEEVAHRDEAIAHGAKETPGYGLLSAVIKTACRIAIKTSENI